ncbi:hypothetical protein KIF59_14380 [Enterobacter cloacae subsp. cloacae]|nr:hypothetical protein [Enterobacter cloacae subsp. cloacae]
MKERDMPQAEPMTDDATGPVGAGLAIATRYRVTCSPGALLAGAPWLKGKPMVPALAARPRGQGCRFSCLPPASSRSTAGVCR